MSAIPSWVRVSRVADGAVARARLTVVPLTRRADARVPFVVLVSLLLLGGVVGLLMFNTSMQQAAFTATRLEGQAAALSTREQTLRMELDVLRDPQRLAEQAQRLGMVPAAYPVFLRLSDGAILGTPAPATERDGIRIRPLAPPKPPDVNPPPLVETVQAPDKTRPDTGRESGNRGDRRGRNGNG